MKKTYFLVLLFAFLLCNRMHAQQLIVDKQIPRSFSISDAVIYVDENDFELVKRAALLFQADVALVTGKKLPLIYKLNSRYKTVIAIGSSTNAAFIKELVAKKKIDLADINGKWEAYNIQSLKTGTKAAPAQNMLVISGSDRRGVAYGVFELSKQMGVSPWYWWADVPVKKQKHIYIDQRIKITDAPKVKYRGFFINDEAPCLSSWAKEKFGGFNHQFYEKVFELLLRLKANYLWPAMWGSAFNSDDTLNPVLADQYGIVMGTSHHEPMLRSQKEWQKFGGGAWDYTNNDSILRAFWKTGIEHMQSHESIVTVGMRGDGDKPMMEGTATALLEQIVTDQRKIIEETTKKSASATPQLWALYKEVQDYYDKGMRVPDDVTLLLCDDNWGNIRRLPKITDAPRKGGYGIYYHFDYVGAPRNYKWLNTNPIPRVWEQMHLAYEHNAREIWIVNVGDIKPMEFPLSFFLDYAWNPEKIAADELQEYTRQWAAAQFGKQYAATIAEIIAKYGKYNGRRKPEMLDANTYSFNYNEWENVTKDYNLLLEKAEKINKLLPVQYRDAYFQLVLHPVKASANLNEMYYNIALNKVAYANKWSRSNSYADKAKELYKNDSLITGEYHRLNNGKWNHMMSQKHIGYINWQEPRFQRMPVVKYVPSDSVRIEMDTTAIVKKANYPLNADYNLSFELNKYVSIDADHFSKAVNANGITWKVLPDLGKTGSAVTVFPVTAAQQQPGGNAPHLEYEYYTYSAGEFTIAAYFSPTLNFHGTAEGLQYAISVDDEAPQVLSLNKEDKTASSANWNKWVGENIIIKTSKHTIANAGKHVVKYWMVNSALVLQKLVLDFGGLQQSYLAPQATGNKR